MDNSLLISVVSGFGAALLALPIQALLANSKAIKILSQVYDSAFTRLQGELDSLRKELEELKPLRCNNLGCLNRVPPRIVNTEPKQDGHEADGKL